MKLKDLILDRLEISISQFCIETGISRATIYNILNDSCKTSRTTIKKICKYFDTDFKDYI